MYDKIEQLKQSLIDAQYWPDDDQDHRFTDKFMREEITRQVQDLEGILLQVVLWICTSMTIITDSQKANQERPPKN